jgi:hypothetical protein
MQNEQAKHVTPQNLGAIFFPTPVRSLSETLFERGGRGEMLTGRLGFRTAKILPRLTDLNRSGVADRSAQQALDVPPSVSRLRAERSTKDNGTDLLYRSGFPLRGIVKEVKGELPGPLRQVALFPDEFK